MHDAWSNSDTPHRIIVVQTSTNLDRDRANLPSRSLLSPQMTNVNVSGRKTALPLSCRATSGTTPRKTWPLYVIISPNECNGTSVQLGCLTMVRSPWSDDQRLLDHVACLDVSYKGFGGIIFRPSIKGYRRWMIPRPKLPRDLHRHHTLVFAFAAFRS